MKHILQKLAHFWDLVGLVDKDKLKPYYDEIVQEVNKKSIEKIRNDAKANNFLSLADKLINIYEETIKERRTPGGFLYIQSRSVIAERLSNQKLNISSYTEDEVLNATRLYLKDNYTNSLDRKFCCTLQYFIWKQKDGCFTSPLLDYINQAKKEGKDDNALSWLY